jgi:CDP-glycerol glycerophosphotransferase (TagB/SpsB family)
MSFGSLLKFAQRTDAKWHRYQNPESRAVLVDSRTPMNYAIMAPIHRALQKDRRVKFYFTASESPGRSPEIYQAAGPAIRIITPARAALMKFDVYLTADQLWVKLPRGARRIQMFHGVAGKYAHVYDTPTRSMREWHRLFFINQKRLNNYKSCGAIDEHSPAAKLVGMPKLDCLVDGSLDRHSILHALGLNPARQSVLYAPTWSPYSSVNSMGLELVEELGKAGYAVMVKLHDRSRDTQFIHSGGKDWGSRMKPVLRKYRGHLAQESDICPYLVAADVLITDHSSVGFEYLLLDRPVVRIEMPELIAQTDIHPDYVRMLEAVSISVSNVQETLLAVEQSLAAPKQKSSIRQQIAKELFYLPGTATARAVQELYEVLELDPLNDAQVDAT